MGKHRRRTSSGSPNDLAAKAPRISMNTSLEVETQADDHVSTVGLKSITDSLDSLGERMDNNFKEMRKDFETFKLYITTEMKMLKVTVIELETSAEASSTRMDAIEANNKAFVESSASLACEIETLKDQLKKEKEKVLHLEDYSRRENLKFRNIPEIPEENCQHLLYDIISSDLGVETDGIRFHAVHRVGKTIGGRPRPILARFVCREDKENVFRQRKRLKESSRFKDAYVTLDYPNEIQEERAVLIKAMLKAQARGMSAKVIGRRLTIGSVNYNVNNVPEEFLS